MILTNPLLGIVRQHGVATSTLNLLLVIKTRACTALKDNKVFLTRKGNGRYFKEKLWRKPRSSFKGPIHKISLTSLLGFKGLSITILTTFSNCT